LDAEKVGGGIGTFIDSFLETRNLEGKLMHLTELPQKILRIVAEAFKNINTADLGKRIGEGLTNAIKNINLDQIGTDLSTIAVKIGDFFGELFDNVSFKDLGKKASGLAKKLIAAIADMLNEVNWEELGSDLARGFNIMAEDFFGDEENLGNATSIVDNITSFLSSLLENIKWEELWENIDTFLEKLPLEDMWSQITQITIRFWETKRVAVKQWISDEIQGAIKGAIELVNQKLQDGSVWEDILNVLKLTGPAAMMGQHPLQQELLSWFGLDDGSLADTFREAFPDLSELFGNLNFENLERSIAQSFGSATNTIKEMAGSIKNALQPAIDGVKSVFDSIKSVVDKIYNKLKDWVSKIEDLVEPLEDVASLFSKTSETITGNINNSSGPRPGEMKKKNHAVGMQGGVILNRGTVFGMDGDTRLVGGEAGKEAVVGVGSLSTMIQSSVLGAISPMSMSTAVEAGVRSAMQGGGSSPVVDVTLKCDSETLFRMVKQGQTAYNGRYHFVEDFA
jgi:hypothetical protein